MTYLDELSSFVAKRVASLYFASQQGGSAATGKLARLRRGLSNTPGSDPLIWEETLGLPSKFEGPDTSPSEAERAVHAAITLFALHQQSQAGLMHRPGASFGEATRRLGKSRDSEAAVLRRFHALGTASNLEEALIHARGLITQFRSNKIPLDYGQFAVDLYELQLPGRMDSVRLRWGRQYYRPERHPSEQHEATAPSHDD